MRDFAETYRAYSDDELTQVQSDVGSLTEQARDALIAEIIRRGLTPSDLVNHSQIPLEPSTAKPWPRLLAQLGIVLGITFATFLIWISLGSHLNNPALHVTAGPFFFYALLFSLLMALVFMRGKLLRTTITTAVIYLAASLFVYLS
jgi:hypothetical protein